MKKVIAKIKAFIDANKKTAVFAGIAVIVIIAVLVVSLIIKLDVVGNALSQKKFKNVEVTYYMALMDRSPVAGQSGTATEIPEGVVSDYSTILGDGTESVQTEEGVSDNIDDNLAEMCVMEKYGDIIHETGRTGERYYYKRDGKDMVMFYDDYYGLKSKEGKWTEIYAEDTYAAPSFEVKNLEKLGKVRFKKVNDQQIGDTYYAIKDYSDKYFYKLIGINDESKYKYTELHFYFDSKKISKIVATYIYDGSYEGKIVYEFQYGSVKKIELPKADVKADKNENK